MMEWLPIECPLEKRPRISARFFPKKKALLLASLTYFVCMKNVLRVRRLASVFAKDSAGVKEYSQSTSCESSTTDIWPPGIVEIRTAAGSTASYQARSSSNQTSAPGSKALT